MGKVHQRRIISETKNKLAAKISEAANELLLENSG